MPAHRWGRLRVEVLARDKYRCTICSRAGRLEVHHVDHDPTNDDLSNLTTLCRSCHIELHAPPVAPAVLAWRNLIAGSDHQ